MDFKLKYLKYKKKYTDLKKQLGGNLEVKKLEKEIEDYLKKKITGKLFMRKLPEFKELLKLRNELAKECYKKQTGGGDEQNPMSKCMNNFDFISSEPWVASDYNKTLFLHLEKDGKTTTWCYVNKFYPADPTIPGDKDETITIDQGITDRLYANWVNKYTRSPYKANTHGKGGTQGNEIYTQWNTPTGAKFYIKYDMRLRSVIEWKDGKTKLKENITLPIGIHASYEKRVAISNAAGSMGVSETHGTAEEDIYRVVNINKIASLAEKKMLEEGNEENTTESMDYKDKSIIPINNEEMVKITRTLKEFKDWLKGSELIESKKQDPDEDLEYKFVERSDTKMNKWTIKRDESAAGLYGDMKRYVEVIYSWLKKCKDTGLFDSLDIVPNPFLESRRDFSRRFGYVSIKLTIKKTHVNEEQTFTPEDLKRIEVLLREPRYQDNKNFLYTIETLEKIKEKFKSWVQPIRKFHEVIESTYKDGEYYFIFPNIDEIFEKIKNLLEMRNSKMKIWEKMSLDSKKKYLKENSDIEEKLTDWVPKKLETEIWNIKDRIKKCKEDKKPFTGLLR